jgi:uncharacterized protein (DUF1330 family)
MKGKLMTGYIIAQIEVTDPDKYKIYANKALPTIEAFGGEILVGGGEMAVLEGNWSKPGCVVLKFPTLEKAMAWYESEDYKQLLDLRQSASNATVIAVEGA